MRVLLVTSMFPPYAGGGVSSHVRDLATSLAKEGHEVSVLTSRRRKAPAPDESRHVPAGVQVIYCEDFRRMAMRIGALTREVQFDVVHFHAFNSLALAALCVGGAGAIVFTLHSDSANYLASVRGWTSHHPAYRAFLLYERFVARIPDVTIAVSNRMAEYGRGIGITGIVRIPNAVDANYWATDPSVPRNGSGPMLLVPRMHVPKNGIEYAADAMRQIVESTHDATMLITGDGPLRSVLERKAREIGSDRIRLVGLVSQEEMRELYRSADVVVIPSVTTSGTQENTSISALEAMASGKPVIATGIGGLLEVIHAGEEGILVPERDADAIAAAAIRLVTDRKLAESIGRQGRARVVKEFSLSGWTKRVLDVYASALALRGRTTAFDPA